MPSAHFFGKASVCALAVLLCLCVASELHGTAQAQTYDAETALTGARGALEQARFDEAKTMVRELLARTDLAPVTRNAALELAAIIDIAARDEATAQQTLAELFARDPEHPRRVLDPGPAVEAAFARARARSEGHVRAAFTADPQRDTNGRLQLRVHLLEGRDAIESLHARTQFPDMSEPVEVVVHPALREWVTLTLPTPLASTQTLSFVIEARSPGGYVLARAGTPEQPKQASLPAPSAAARPCTGTPPLRRAWWLWTTVGLVVAGIAVSAGVVAQ